MLLTVDNTDEIGSGLMLFSRHDTIYGLSYMTVCISDAFGITIPLSHETYDKISDDMFICPRFDFSPKM